MKIRITVSIIIFMIFFLLASSLGPKALAHKVIVIDPGHGGIYPGAVANGLREADINLLVAGKLRDRLALSGATVIMTRASDCNLAPPGSTLATDLQARVDVAKASKADIFVSLHANFSINPQSAGAISFFPKDKSDSLARAIQSSLVKNFGFANDVRPANFYVLIHNDVPAALIEMGFLTNAKEALRLADEAYQDRLADSICEGIITYFNFLGL